MPAGSLLPLIFLNAVFTALYLTTSSLFMKRKGGLHFISAITYTHLAGGVVMLLLWACTHEVRLLWDIGREFWIFLCWSVLVNMVAKVLYFYAYSKIEVANVTIFSSFTPLFAVITGWLFLHEVLSPSDIAGICIVCAAVYYFHFRKQLGVSVLRSIVAPFLGIFHSRPVLAAFLSTIPPAFSIIYSKKAILLFDPFIFTALQLVMMGGAFFVVEMMMPGKERRLPLSRLPYKEIAGLSLLLLLAAITASCVITLGPVAHILSLQRLSIVLQVVFAYTLLKERTDIRKKLLACALVLLGAWMLEM